MLTYTDQSKYLTAHRKVYRAEMRRRNIPETVLASAGGLSLRCFLNFMAGRTYAPSSVTLNKINKVLGISLKNPYGEDVVVFDGGLGEVEND